MYFAIREHCPSYIFVHTLLLSTRSQFFGQLSEKTDCRYNAVSYTRAGSCYYFATFHESIPYSESGTDGNFWSTMNDPPRDSGETHCEKS